MSAEVRFISKPPYETWGVEIQFRLAERPDDLINAMASIGWTEGNDTPPPPVDGVATLCIQKGGATIFSEWSADEGRAFMAEARRVLRDHGFSRVPRHRLAVGETL